MKSMDIQMVAYVHKDDLIDEFAAIDKQFEN